VHTLLSSPWGAPFEAPKGSAAADRAPTDRPLAGGHEEAAKEVPPGGVQGPANGGGGNRNRVQPVRPSDKFSTVRKPGLRFEGLPNG
jgi:hypothetical protein